MSSSVVIINRRSKRSKFNNRSKRNTRINRSKKNNSKSNIKANNTTSNLDECVYDLFDKIKNAQNTINLGLENKDISFKYELVSLEDKFMPSKLDVLKVLNKENTKLPPKIKAILNDKQQDIKNGTNIVEIDKAISLADRTFFSMFLSAGSVFEWINDLDFKKLLKNNTIDKLHPEMGPFVGLQTSEKMASMKYNYKITFIYKRNEKRKEGDISIYTDEKINDDKLNQLIIKLINNILLYPLIFKSADKMPFPKLKIYLIKQDKQLPTKKEGESQIIFTADTINSGLTTGDTILLFREEELLKVLLHECIHYYRVVNCFNDTIDSRYKITSLAKHAYFETIIETLADIINCIMISTNKDELKENMAKEINFIFTQAGKILHYAGYMKWNDYFSDTPNKDAQPNKIVETTNMHAYYILRTLLFWNKNYNIILKQIYDTLDCNKIVETINKIGNEENFKEEINKYISFPIENHNLRMTSLE
jgi:hypothetical protein